MFSYKKLNPHTNKNITQPYKIKSVIISKLYVSIKTTERGKIPLHLKDIQ